MLAAIRDGSLPNPWTVADCRVDPKDATSPTRIYFGCDGVMAPMVTAAETVKRREKVKAKRKRCGKKVGRAAAGEAGCG
ncbi:MAG: hypothetical protein U0791_14895 [Gemmataceae bacterium]